MESSMLLYFPKKIKAISVEMAFFIQRDRMRKFWLMSKVEI